jgi:hypothetical protein
VHSQRMYCSQPSGQPSNRHECTANEKDCKKTQFAKHMQHETKAAQPPADAHVASTVLLNAGATEHHAHGSNLAATPHTQLQHPSRMRCITLWCFMSYYAAVLCSATSQAPSHNPTKRDGALLCSQRQVATTGPVHVKSAAAAAAPNAAAPYSIPICHKKLRQTAH